MKKIAFILMFLINIVLLGQSFEGVLTYKTDIELSQKMKEMGLTKEIIMKKMKEENSFSDQIKYTYKGSNYLMQMLDNGTETKYIGEENTIYTREKDDDLIIAIDASIDLENQMFGTSPKIEKKETDVIILDKKCDKVIVTWKTGTYEYYYNSGFLKMDSDLYKNHKYDMWFEFLQVSRSLPLRIVKKVSGMMTITMDLIDVKEFKVDMAKFDLPKMKLDKEMSKYVAKNQVVYKVNNG